MTDDKLRQEAEAYATHAKDCSCKGKTFNKDKYEGYIAGYLAHAPKAEVLVRALKWAENWASSHVAERNVLLIEVLQEALAAYKGSDE